MSALFSDEQNARDVFLLASYGDDLTNAAAAGVVKFRFVCPVSCTVTRMVFGYETEGGTTPAATMALRRVTTAILSCAATTNATLVTDTVAETSQVLTCDKGEELNLFLTTANDDNDFAGVSCQVWATRR